MADLKSGRTNVDFLIALMDRYEGKNGPNNKEMHSVEVSKRMLLNLSLSSMLKEKPKRATSSVSGRVGKLHHEADLSPAHEEERFFVCGQDSLAVLLQETARGCACGTLSSEKPWNYISFKFKTSSTGGNTVNSK